MKSQLHIFRTVFFITIVFYLSSSTAMAQSDKKYIRQGNVKYSDDKYAESEILYRKAIDANKISGDAVFNLGDALYKQNKFEEAGKQFIDNAEKEKKIDKKADSYYNMGNSLLKANKLKESISAYKNSLKLDPGNSEAKYNLAYAQDLLRMQEQKEKQQQENNKQQDKDQNSKDQQQNKDQEKKDQQQQKDDQSQQQQQQQQPQQISKEDAQRLLDALANDEKKVQEKVKEAKAAKARVKTLINW